MVDFKDCCETELDTSLSFGTMRKLTTTLLEEIQKELDKLAATGKSLSEFYKILKCSIIFWVFFTELQRVSRFAGMQGYELFQLTVVLCQITSNSTYLLCNS